MVGCVVCMRWDVWCVMCGVRCVRCDPLQHFELARDIADSFNSTTLPEPQPLLGQLCGVCVV